MQVIQYIIVATVCLSIFYAGYRLIFRTDTHFVQARTFLILSIIMSLVIPFNQFKIETGLSWQKKIPQTLLVPIGIQDQLAIPFDTATNSNPQVIKSKPTVQWKDIALALYLVLSIGLLIRIIVQLFILIIQYHRSFKLKKDDCILLYNHRFSNTFSFFRWIFIYYNVSDEEFEQIIAHEKIHVKQVHSLDLIIAEILTAVMWFNPLVWMMKNSIQQVHEYLADEGALNTGIDRIKYQTLLINQVSEERLICLSSSFNHSLIKNRIIMMTKSKNDQRSTSKWLTLIPVSAIIFVMLSAFNGVFSENVREDMKPGIGSPEPGILPDLKSSELPRDSVKKMVITKTYLDEDSKDTLIEKELRIISVNSDSEDNENFMFNESGNISINNDGNMIKFIVAKPDSNGVKYSYSTVNTGKHRLIKADTIITREDVKNEPVEEGKVIKQTVEIRTSGEKRSNILYIIDGVPSKLRDPLSTIDPKAINSIEVVNDSQISKYTSDPYDGVIIITTKVLKKN